MLFIQTSRRAVFQGHSDHFARKCFGATNTPSVGCEWHYICVCVVVLKSNEVDIKKKLWHKVKSKKHCLVKKYCLIMIIWTCSMPRNIFLVVAKVGKYFKLKSPTFYIEIGVQKLFIIKLTTLILWLFTWQQFCFIFKPFFVEADSWDSSSVNAKYLARHFHTLWPRMTCTFQTENDYIS